MSNELIPRSPEPPEPTLLEELRPAEDVRNPPLVLLAGDEDLVCVDDTCLPPEVAR